VSDELSSSEQGGTADAGADTPILPKQISVEELTDPSNCLSALHQRPFVGQTDYKGGKALDAAHAAATQALPKVESAYKPSGKTTGGATVSMLLASPLVLLLLLLICGGICFGWIMFQVARLSDGSETSAEIAGAVSILIDIVVIVLMIFAPVLSFGFLSRVFKNRNPLLPAVLTGIVDLLAAIVLFVPIWHGNTLAPTDLTLNGLPIRWVLIILGGLVIPVVAAVVVYQKIAGRKFCEETGFFLKPLSRLRLRFDFAENALALLKRGEYLALASLPRAEEQHIKKKHFAEVVLWGHDQAATAYLGVEVHFAGNSKPVKKISLEESKVVRVKWLVFSARLDETQTRSLLQTFPAG